jgi:hypothetical protein
MYASQVSKGRDFINFSIYFQVYSVNKKNGMTTRKSGVAAIYVHYYVYI